MCSACGVLSGTPDWMDRASNPDGIGNNNNETRRSERAKLVRMVNILLAPGRTKISDFGEKMIIKGATGRTRIVDDLNHVWVEADNFGLKAVDPLDPSYLDSL